MTVRISLQVANTALLCGYHYDMRAALEEALELANLVLTQLFAVELLLKLAGWGAAAALREPWWVFDAIIVIASEVELGVAGANVSALRTMRLMRTLRLAKTFTGLQSLIATFLASLRQLCNFFFIFALVLLIFALLGVQMFGGKYTAENGLEPQVVAADGSMVPAAAFHFESVPAALVTLFVVISGENWNEVYFTAHAAAGVGATFYFVALVVIGEYVLVNLFVAILLGSFQATVVGEDDGRVSFVRRFIFQHRHRAPRWLAPTLFDGPAWREELRRRDRGRRRQQLREAAAEGRRMNVTPPASPMATAAAGPQTSTTDDDAAPAELRSSMRVSRGAAGSDRRLREQCFRGSRFSPPASRAEEFERGGQQGAGVAASPMAASPIDGVREASMGNDLLESEHARRSNLMGRAPSHRCII